MSVGAALVLGLGVGFAAWPAFCIATALVGARLHDRHLALDELGTGWWE